MRAQRWRETAGKEDIVVALIRVQTPDVQLRLAPSHVYVQGELDVCEGDKGGFLLVALMVIDRRSSARWRQGRHRLMSVSKWKYFSGYQFHL